MQETFFGITRALKKFHHFVYEDKRCYQRIPMFYKNKRHFLDRLSRRSFFWNAAVPCGSENSHNVVQLSPNEDKYYPHPISCTNITLKKFSPLSLRSIAHHPNKDLQSVGMDCKSD